MKERPNRPPVEPVDRREAGGVRYDLRAEHALADIRLRTADAPSVPSVPADGRRASREDAAPVTRRGGVGRRVSGLLIVVAIVATVPSAAVHLLGIRHLNDTAVRPPMQAAGQSPAPAVRQPPPPTAGQPRVPATQQPDRPAAEQPPASHDGDGGAVAAAREPDRPAPPVVAALASLPSNPTPAQTTSSLPAASTTQATQGHAPAATMREAASALRKAPTGSVAAPGVATETASPHGSDAAAPPVPDGVVRTLLTRGDALLATGDVASARLFYQRGADSGSGTAALRLGETFDPAFLARAGLGQIKGDVKKAAFWYRRAHDLGIRDAAVLLQSIKPAEQP